MYSLNWCRSLHLPPPALLLCVIWPPRTSDFYQNINIYILKHNSIMNHSMIQSVLDIHMQMQTTFKKYYFWVHFLQKACQCCLSKCYFKTLGILAFLIWHLCMQLLYSTFVNKIRTSISIKVISRFQSKILDSTNAKIT